MQWQVEYALDNIKNDGSLSAECINPEVIKIAIQNKPDVLASISAAHIITKGVVEQVVRGTPKINFLCGYRKNCVWDGEAIAYLKSCNIGWGNFGTLISESKAGNANLAEHKEYFFSVRLIRGYYLVEKFDREYCRVFKVTLKNGIEIRVGMIQDYEVTSDSVRSLFENFGQLNIAWNINPNGSSSTSALNAGSELGCKVLKWGDLKNHMRSLS
jgi:hypothetical protein